ncbi:MAG: CopD family protein, partial [Nitrospinota bacterium]|nr:CopD family protein [Nitrospinota bacterium]
HIVGVVVWFAGLFYLVRLFIYHVEAAELDPPIKEAFEEQYMLMLEGELNMILGDEERIIGKGDMVHIPRNTRHGVVAVVGPAVFFAVKSPCGDGNLDQDYNRAEDADEVIGRLKRGWAEGA